MFNFLDNKKTYIGGVTVILGAALFVYATIVGDAEMTTLALTLIGVGFGGAFVGLGHKGQKILAAILTLAAHLKELANNQPTPEEPEE